MPQLSRLNPIEGFGRIFTMRSLVELGKALAKFGVVAVIAVLGCGTMPPRCWRSVASLCSRRSAMRSS
jgi:flagellar biosynthesis protein FlhB